MDYLTALTNKITAYNTPMLVQVYNLCLAFKKQSISLFALTSNTSSSQIDSKKE